MTCSVLNIESETSSKPFNVTSNSTSTNFSFLKGIMKLYAGRVGASNKAEPLTFCFSNRN